MAETPYQRPDWFTRTVFNPLVAAVTRAGLPLAGSRVLEVRGRLTGEPRRTPVNLLVLGGEHYLVAPRGVTQWVRNARADGGRVATLVGRRRQEWVIEELPAPEGVPVLREYLRKWAWEVGAFFPEGVSVRSTDDELAAVLPAHPVFRLVPRG